MPDLPKIKNGKIKTLVSRTTHRCTGGRALSLQIRILTLLVSTWALAPMATAQVSASLSGTVTDPSGAAISGATVTVRDTHTEVQRGTVTDGTG